MFKTCVWGYCLEDNVRSPGTLCDDWLDHLDNVTCREAGLYGVKSTESILAADITNGWSWAD